MPAFPTSHGCPNTQPQNPTSAANTEHLSTATADDSDGQRPRRSGESRRRPNVVGRFRTLHFPPLKPPSTAQRIVASSYSPPVPAQHHAAGSRRLRRHNRMPADRYTTRARSGTAGPTPEAVSEFPIEESPGPGPGPRLSFLPALFSFFSWPCLSSLRARGRLCGLTRPTQ